VKEIITKALIANAAKHSYIFVQVWEMTARTTFILCFLLISGTAFSQDTLNTIKRFEYVEPHDFSYEKEWDYFILEDTIVVKIIDHLSAPSACGVYATASMSIAQTEMGDTIRIIEMCNVSDKYKKGHMMKVAPADKPLFGLITPFTLIENPKTKKFEPSTFDLTVLKTTWGYFLYK